MLNIDKILLPVDFPRTSLRVVHQAATLAHRFHSEIVMLHVANLRSHAAASPEEDTKIPGEDMLAEIIAEAEKNLDQSLAPELDSLTIRRVLAKGDPAQAICKRLRRKQLT
ncbi:MAG TPA: universal stress protein [Terriglobales bacterium]|jgi:hypothetical protein|nr:universal stress protein [Terriglobales bacterium]